MNTIHYIINVQDSINDYKTVQGGYVDAPNASLAKEHFRAHAPWSKYFGNMRYQITMKTNPDILQYPES